MTQPNAPKTAPEKADVNQYRPQRTVTLDLDLYDRQGMGRSVLTIRLPRFLIRRVERWVNDT